MTEEWSQQVGPFELVARRSGFWSVAALPNAALGRFSRALSFPAAKRQALDFAIAQARAWLLELLAARGSRLCAAPDCEVIFRPRGDTVADSFHSERCMHRTHKRERRRKRAQIARERETRQNAARRTHAKAS